MTPLKGRVLVLAGALSLTSFVLAVSVVVPDGHPSGLRAPTAASDAGLGVGQPPVVEERLDRAWRASRSRPLVSPSPVSTIRIPKKPAIRRHAQLTRANTDDAFGWPWGPLVKCEAGRFGWRYGAPDVGTDPGYDFEGGPNFTHGTWVSHGGREFAEHAYDATPSEQIIVAKRVLADQGWGAWPTCSRKLGLR